jgi:hypothetical protein
MVATEERARISIDLDADPISAFDAWVDPPLMELAIQIADQHARSPDRSPSWWDVFNCRTRRWPGHHA